MINATPKPWLKILGFLLYYGSCISLICAIYHFNKSKQQMLFEALLGICGFVLYYTRIRGRG
jgi:hypothetical protein